MSPERKKAYLALLIASIIWGLAPPVIKYTLQFISPVAFLFYRFLFASILVVIPLVLRWRKIKPSKKELLLYLFLGVLCSPLNLLLLFWGIARTTAIDASLISIISPILIVLGGSLFLKEKVTKIERIGIAITVIGAILTIIQPFLETKAVGGNFSGNFLVFLGTLVWVVFTLLAKKYRQLDPFLLTAISFLVGFFVLLPFARLSAGQAFSFPTTNAMLGVLFMAIFSSVVAYLAYSYGLAKIEASEATIFTYIQPLFAVPLAVIFLHEKLTLPFIIGALFITIGVFICEYRFKSPN